jgi:hypothetical protein
LKFQTRHIVNHLDPRSVETRNGGDKAKPEAITRAASALFEPIETFQHVFALVRSNPRPIVGDGKNNSLISPLNFRRHYACLLPMFDGVVDQIGSCIE